MPPSYATGMRGRKGGKALKFLGGGQGHARKELRNSTCHMARRTTTARPMNQAIVPCGVKKNRSKEGEIVAEAR